MGKKEKYDEVDKLLKESKVQLLLSKILNSESRVLRPTLNENLGFRYLDVEAYLEKNEAEKLLHVLQDHGLLKSEVSGFLVCCSQCKSPSLEEVGFSTVKRIDESIKADAWRCNSCGASLGNEIGYKPVFSYRFSKKGIERISDMLVVKPIIDFLHERGYNVAIPGKLKGESNIEHSFDVVAHGDKLDESVLVIDFIISESKDVDDKIREMFAKVFDTNPHKSILASFQRLKEDEKRLADHYGIQIVEPNKFGQLWKELINIIPPVSDLYSKTLDVMTLLSLPDHLRKTATVVSSKGKAAADEIASTTERARAVESSYLNQLVRMGCLKKERIGRRVLFSVVS